MPNNVDLKAFSHLLDDLYVGASEHDKWQTFLSHIKELLNLQFASLVLRQPTPNDPGLLFTSGASDDLTILDSADNDYTSEFFAQDPLINLPLNQVVTLSDTITQDELRKSEYYKLFLKPMGIEQIAGIDWLASNGSRVSIRFTRDDVNKPFTQDDQELLELLIPHLEHAVSFSLEKQQLMSERQVYAQFISKRSIGIVTLDKQGEIVQLNNTAEQYINKDDGLIRSRNHLLTSSNALNDSLKGFINDALEAKRNKQRIPINALSVPRSSGEMDYQLVIKPIPSNRHIESESAPCLMIFLQDPEKNLEISVRLLMNLYQLTLSEATIAILLSEGNTMDDVAEELDVKKNTVRAHLRSIFAKTGVTQQSMLVSLVLTSLASSS